ncbi:hypothetical protein [Shewanella sp. S1-58-MNA-CIBAN-0166]|uniref:hypothetical protein n=1 Tax=Shewanella sp. S1-58-MNA-CIBAN-0166 TaxID=3140467 RepID=UPI0033233062
MTRTDMIQKLQQFAPIITLVTVTDDMGFEFSAVVPDGVIYSESGMLLEYSSGQWPPSEWEDDTDEELTLLRQEFLLDETWQVIPWADLEDKEIAQWLEDVQNI